jgi:hypothetical protein
MEPKYKLEHQPGLNTGLIVPNPDYIPGRTYEEEVELDLDLNHNSMSEHRHYDTSE